MFGVGVAAVCQETPPAPVEVRTWFTVPVEIPSHKEPVKAIPAVVDVIPVAENVLFPLQVLLPKDVILLFADKLITLVPVKVMPTFKAVLPVSNTCCKVGADPGGIALDQATPVPVEVSH